MADLLREQIKKRIIIFSRSKCPAGNDREVPLAIIENVKIIIAKP